MLQTWGCGDRGGVTGGRCVQVRQAQAVAGGGLAGMRGLWGFEVGSGLCRLWLSKDAQGLVRSGSCGDERKRRDQWEAPAWSRWRHPRRGGSCGSRVHFGGGQAAGRATVPGPESCHLFPWGIGPETVGTRSGRCSRGVGGSSQSSGGWPSPPCGSPSCPARLVWAGHLEAGGACGLPWTRGPTALRRNTFPKSLESGYFTLRNRSQKARDCHLLDNA